MKLIYRIARTELNVLFYSPVAWLILIVFTIQCGMNYCEVIWNPVKYQMLGRDWGNLTEYIYGRGIFSAMLKHLYFYIPLLTMGLMSREFSSGSVKLLYSSPVTNRQIISGKYLSMMIYCGILLSVIGGYVLMGAFTIENLDWTLLFANFLGMYLLICSYAAIGLFMSSLTSYQVVAAVCTLAFLSVLNYIGDVGKEIAFVRELTSWLSLKGRAQGFVNGLVHSESVIYFVVVIVLFLTLSVWRLQAIRETQTPKRWFFKYLLLVSVVILVSYGTSRPYLTFYWDATATKKNTISPVTRQLIDSLKGDLKITTYVNLLDPYYENGLPAAYKADFERFRPYIRFKPGIRLEYVYYYDRADNAYLDEKYPGLTDRERAERICEGRKLKFGRFMPPEEIRRKIDLSSENNRFVRLVEWQEKKEWLRIYNDMYRFPSQQEIGAAFKRLVEGPVKIAFLKGHGERSITSPGEEAYSSFSVQKTARNALVNQGFDVEGISLEIPRIPEETDILVIVGLKQALTETEIKKIRDYTERGGNLFVLGEPGCQEWMNPLVEPLGVKFREGRLVQQNRDFDPTLVTAGLTREATVKFPDYARPFRMHFNMIMPGCVGLKLEEKDFEICVIARSQDSCSWNETREVLTEEYLEELNRMTEVSGCSYPVMVALSRQVGNKEQRIIVAGDADCISNQELGKFRNGIRSLNSVIPTASFRWLSYGKYPIEIVPEPSKDNKLTICRKAMPWMKFSTMGVLPCLLGIAYGIQRNRRRRK